MKRKLSRPGVAVLAALAPACAIGVIVPAIMLSLKKEETATIDQFLEKYETFYLTAQTNLSKSVCYDGRDITNNNVNGNLTVNGTVYQLNSLEIQRGTSIINLANFTTPGDDAQFQSINVFRKKADMKSKLEEYQAQHTSYKYIVEDTEISYEFKDENGVVKQAMKLNYYGYMTYLYETDSDIKELKMTYKIAPHN